MRTREVLVLSIGIYRHYICLLCVVIPFILNVSFVDVTAGVTQEEGHTGFLHLPFVVLALIFIASRIQPSLPPPVLSTCPLYTNRCGKEKRILIGPW